MARAKLSEVYEENTDPNNADLEVLKRSILKSLSPQVDDIYPLGYEVVVATFIRPEKTRGGIILTVGALSEDRFQGKVGLLVKIGPEAFEGKRWATLKPKLHDWVYYNASDGIEMFVVDTHDKGHPCRRMDDVSIRGITKDPFSIW